MRKLLPLGTAGLAGLLGLGLLAGPAVSSLSAQRGNDDGFIKREEHAAELVLVDDDDDADSNSNSRSRFTGYSRSTNDSTGSNFTRVSRDRDLSRSDKTRDWTRDGGDRTRDHSNNRTNDRSRNDSRR
jgi:hypothetical protein